MIQTIVAGGFYNPAIVTGNTVIGGTSGVLNRVQACGQQILPQQDIQVQGVRVNMKKVGLPTDTLVVELLSTSITGAQIVVANVLAANLKTTDYTYDVLFNGLASLTAYNYYYLRFTRSPDTEDGSNYVTIGGAGTNGYSSGLFQYKYNNSWATDAGDDLYFGLLVDRNVPAGVNPSVVVGNGMSRSERCT
jgi:hypothetical protein